MCINRLWNVCKQIDCTSMHLRTAGTLCLPRALPRSSKWMMDGVRVWKNDTKEHPFISVVQLILLFCHPLRHSISRQHPPNPHPALCVSLLTFAVKAFLYFFPQKFILVSLSPPLILNFETRTFGLCNKHGHCDLQTYSYPHWTSMWSFLHLMKCNRKPFIIFYEDFKLWFNKGKCCGHLQQKKKKHLKEWQIPIYSHSGNIMLWRCILQQVLLLIFTAVSIFT